MFILTASCFFGQKESLVIDSLKKRLLHPRNDSDRSYVLDLISKEYFDSNIDSSLTYGKRSLEVAKKIKLVEYQVDALNSLGIATRKKGDYKGALVYHTEALKLVQVHKLSSYYLQSIYSCFCLVYTEQGNYTAAIDYSFKALHEAEKQKDTLNQAVTHNNLADIYFNTHHYDKALDHYKRSLAIATLLKNEYGMGLLAGNMGSVYYETGKLDSAKLFFEKALLSAKKVHDVFGEGNYLENIGSYYQKKGQNDKALSYFEQAEKIYRENQLNPELSTAYYNIATVYLESGQYPKSKEYATKSLLLAESINSYPHKQSAHEALKNVFEKLNDTKMAYYHYREYIAARDSIFNQENRKAQYRSEMEYEYAKKRDADSLLQAANDKIQQEKLEQEQLRTRTQRKFTYAAMLGCLVLLVLVIFVFKGYRDKQKANRIITEQKREAELQKEIIEEKQKEILDSIHYAKRIQQSLLPNEKLLRKLMQKAGKRA